MPQPQQHYHSMLGASVDDWDQLRKLRRYLLLLASLAATVTYAAGLDPPGGSYVESEGEHKAGDSILRATHHRRYLAFYYSNATAFAASLVVILLLLVLPDKKKKRQPDLDLQTGTHLHVLQFVMVLDLLALMVAYTTGSCRDKAATIYTAALVLVLSAYVGYHIFVALRDNFSRTPRSQPVESPELEQLRKVLMLLSIFAATITYDAGLKPPGGFWEQEHTTDGGQHPAPGHRPGEVILKYMHGGRFTVFFFCNTTAFISSLFTVVLLLEKKLTASRTRQQLPTLYVFVVLTLVALVAAYAAGSCRKTSTTTYTAALAAPVLVSIFLAAAADYIGEKVLSLLQDAGIISSAQPQPQQGDGQPHDLLKEKRSLILLLGTLAASIAYQAGLNPPGGVWLENQSGHKAGDPILSYTDYKRYNIFFYCNSIALVASIVVILIVQIKALLKWRALHVHVAMIFDLFGLVGAYIAGSSRTLSASVHLIVLAAVFLVYVMGTYLHVIKFEREAAKTNSSDADDPQNQPQNAAAAGDGISLKKRRKRLLLFAILMAAISYQAGLSPPGGFWREEQGGHVGVGSPILEDMYPRRYKAFFYCNAMSFMASNALIVLLQDDRTYKPVAMIRFYGLYACMLVGMLVLMGAYAAGTARRVRTSIYVFVLVGGVSVFIAVLLALYLFIFIRRQQHQEKKKAAAAAEVNANGGGTAGSNNDNESSNHHPPHHDNHLDRQSFNANGGDTAENNGGDVDNYLDRQSSNANGGGTAENNGGGGDDNHRRRGEEHHAKRKYVMLLAMLAASVTYQAGLDPPGGVWSEGYAAGSSVLHDSNLRRYRVFFYSNSSSFVASIIVIILLLRSELRNNGFFNKKLRNNVQRGSDDPLLMATNTVVALDLVGLLLAYAAGSSRTLEASLNVIALVVVVVIYIVAVRLPWTSWTSNTQGASGERGNGANGQHTQV